MNSVILTEEDMKNAIEFLASSVMDDVKDFDKFAIVGVQTRGVDIAKRLISAIEEKSGKKVKSGILDITFFRDDLSSRGVLPAIKETDIHFDVNDMNILLVDDVLFTGRTIKAALETLMSYGRPKSIKLAVLVDRGNRELPIQADYLGVKRDTGISDKVCVRVKERDGRDEVVLVTA